MILSFPSKHLRVLEALKTSQGRSVDHEMAVSAADEVATRVNEIGVRSIEALASVWTEISFCWFRIGDDQEVAIVTPSEGGSFKNLFLGRMSLGDRIVDVAVVETKTSPLGCGEYDIFSRAISQPIPGMVPVLGITKHPDKPGMGTAFTAVFPAFSCDLYQLLTVSGCLRSLSSEVKLNIQRKIVEAIVQFHRAGWLHRDIKPENILVSIPDLDSIQNLSVDTVNRSGLRMELCLTDMGFALEIKNNPTVNSVPGSLLYFPPEGVSFLQDKKNNPVLTFSPTFANDAWSCGLILLMIEDYSLYSKVVCYQGRTEDEKRGKWFSAYLQYFNDKKISCFQEPKDKDSMLHIVWKLLHPDPARRLSLEVALRKIEMLEMIRNYFLLDVS